MELWKQITTFPDYSVSDEGSVRNDRTGHRLALLRNQRGIIHVGLNRGNAQYKRSVTVLVAETFLPPPPSEAFDTPINLNGDRSHNFVENLLWRPRWFAVRYHQQFFNDLRGYDRPIEEVETGEQFETSWEAATRYGLIDTYIKMAIINEHRVWPTNQLYRVL